jgi:UDP-glucuronate 4-epimerase
MCEQKRVALVTGAAGFIGYHMAKKLSESGYSVIGIDSLSDYYDVELKKRRQTNLETQHGVTVINGKLEEPDFLSEVFDNFRPSKVVHLAAQAGVRHSIEFPRSYVETNLVGTFEVLEAARNFKVEHLMMASTSSVYGGNSDMPFFENHKTEHQMSFYAATKKANENMAHSYSHLYGIPVTMLRFFTVYGPWGRPDMALFKFVDAIRRDEPIDIYNNGKMERDFTYVGDLVEAIFKLSYCPPANVNAENREINNGDSISPIAPFRVVNIGNGVTVNLMDFIHEIENALGKSARKKYLPMQPGDVGRTYASNALLYDLTGYTPQTDVKQGISAFTNWYNTYYS